MIVDSIIINKHLDCNGDETYRTEEGIEIHPDKYLLYPIQPAVLTPSNRLRVRLALKTHRLRKGAMYSI